MKIAMMAALPWEVRRFLSEGGLKGAGREFAAREGETSVRLKISGIGRERARAAAAALLGDGPDVLILTGFAGGISPELAAGDIVLDRDRSDPRAAQWALQAGLDCGLKVVPTAFYCAQSTLKTVEEKAEAYRRTGAACVDMESEAVGAACRESSVAFLSLRAVSDAWDQALPRAAWSLGPGGDVGFRFLGSLLSRPQEWGGFFRLVRSTRKAERSLAAILKGTLAHAKNF